VLPEFEGGLRAIAAHAFVPRFFLRKKSRINERSAPAIAEV